VGGGSTGGGWGGNGEGVCIRGRGVSEGLSRGRDGIRCNE